MLLKSLSILYPYGEMELLLFFLNYYLPNNKLAYRHYKFRWKKKKVHLAIWCVLQAENRATNFTMKVCHITHQMHYLYKSEHV